MKNLENMYTVVATTMDGKNRVVIHKTADGALDAMEQAIEYLFYNNHDTSNVKYEILPGYHE